MKVHYRNNIPASLPPQVHWRIVVSIRLTLCVYAADIRIAATFELIELLIILFSLQVVDVRKFKIVM